MMNRGNNGSVLILVLVVAGATGLVLSSLNSLAMTEKELNDDSRLIIEAKEAAEAVVECGFGQLVKRFQSQNSFPINALSPSTGNPLKLTDAFYSLFQNSHGTMKSKVRLPSYPYNTGATWNSQETELIGGLIPPGEWKFIDGRVPGNEFDPLRDKLVFIREVQVYGKATVVNVANNYRYTSHVTQLLQVRDAPLFAHAIFYNMDMEIAPGPAMDIFGAVHANGDMFIQANNSLDFYKNVSSTGTVHHGPNPIITKASSYGGVTFTDGLGNQLSMHDGSNWIDSDMTDFRSIASNRWNGNLQTFEHGIPFHNPVAMPAYVRDNPATAAVDDQLNYAYQLIQPVESTSDPDYNAGVEEQKFHYKAGLVIKVDTSSGTASAYIYDNDGSGNKQFSGGLPVMTKLDMDANVVNVETYTASGDTVNGGLYDQRMRSGINLVEIDVNRLKHLIENDNDTDWKSGGGTEYKPSSWWNGVIYVDLPQKADPNRPDNVRPAVDNWGVKLTNGSQIPNPSFGWTSDLYGTTIATNVPMYIEGNYNADGNPNTGSATEPDVADVKQEPPAALVADAINVLSNDWQDDESLKNTSTRTTTAFTEVAAAFLTGLVPSNKNNWNNYSGGVENFPRFLEKWNTSFRYRGSMVALFESEVAIEPWGKSNVYSPPTRDWGFNSLYSQGFYPPGTPNSRTFRRVNYRNLTAQEYQSHLSQVAAVMGP